MTDNQTVFMHVITIDGVRYHVASQVGRYLEEDELKRWRAAQLAVLQAGFNNDVQAYALATQRRDTLGWIVPRNYGQDTSIAGILADAVQRYQCALEAIRERNDRMAASRGNRYDPTQCMVEVHGDQDLIEVHALISTLCHLHAGKLRMALACFQQARAEMNDYDGDRFTGEENDAMLYLESVVRSLIDAE